MTKTLLSLSAISFLLAGCGASAVPTVQPATKATPVSQPMESLTPRPSGDVILNDQVGWPKSPGEDVVLKDELGFDNGRLYHVPAPGVHPRILFGPEDLPRIKEQLDQTEMGREMMKTIRDNLAKGIDKPGTYENTCFTALLKGDVPEFEADYQTDFSGRLPGAGPSEEALHRVSVRWGQREPFLTSLEMRCWVALIDGDAARGKEDAAALATYARHLQPRLEKAAAGPFGDNWWKGIRPALGPDSELAFGYDWTAPYMTIEQAGVVRHVISLATAGKYTLGMDLPHHWRTWNYIGMALHEPVLSLAIEGEPGYDPRIYQRGIEVARDYLTYGITKDGFGKEGIGYQTAGMAHTGVLMLAAANRGDNLFLHPHYQQYVGPYLYSAMAPFGGDWLSEGDLAVFPPNIAVASLSKFVFPTNAMVDTVFRNHPNVKAKTYGAAFDGGVNETLLVGPSDPNPSGNPTPSSPPPGAPGDGLTLFDANRGMLITRTAWTPDAVDLHFDCRTDATYASHEHSDHGQFTFDADGCAWAVTGIRDTETKYHNCVTIDGHGQGYFPPPGKWIGLNQSAGGVVGTVDTKYCWDWFWPKPILLEPPDQLKREGEYDVYAEMAARLFGRTPRSAFERDTQPNALAFYSGFLAGDPRMWEEDSWVYRAPNYPVQRAFRSAGVIRGKHPYIVVMDDIQKDDQQHLYEWNMLCPMDVDVISILGNDVVLSNAPGSFYNQRATTQAVAASRGKGGPRLLVRALNVNQPTVFAALQPNPTLETIELKKHDDSLQFAGRSNGLIRRLVFPSRSIAPDYKVVLIPFLQGQEQPTTTWNDDRTVATLDWDDQHDRLAFKKLDNGQTSLSVTRNGKTIAQTP